MLFIYTDFNTLYLQDMPQGYYDPYQDPDITYDLSEFPEVSLSISNFNFDITVMIVVSSE